jgi:hypothetical protein
MNTKLNGFEREYFIVCDLYVYIGDRDRALRVHTHAERSAKFFIFLP